MKSIMKNKLKEVRSSNHITQARLAKLMNINQQTVSSWETGRTTPDPYQMSYLEDLFKTPKVKIFLQLLTTKPS